jgi:hypothetical protein
MILRWEVYDYVAVVRCVSVRVTESYFAALTALHVVFEHLRISLLEGESNAFSHDADAIHGINERVRR